MSIKRKRWRRGALLAARQLHTVGAVRARQKNLCVYFTFLRFGYGTALGVDHQRSIGGRYYVPDGPHFEREFGSPRGRRLSPCRGGQQNGK